MSGFQSTERDELFLESVSGQIHWFLSCEQRNVSILLFPPFNAYLRRLIHKFVEEKHDGLGLTTFSIGLDGRRRTAVCFEHLRKMNTRKDLKSKNIANNHYVPPPARKEGGGCESSSKQTKKRLNGSSNSSEAKLCNDSSLLFEQSSSHVCNASINKELPLRSTEKFKSQPNVNPTKSSSDKTVFSKQIQSVTPSNRKLSNNQESLEPGHSVEKAKTSTTQFPDSSRKLCDDSSLLFSNTHSTLYPTKNQSYQKSRTKSKPNEVKNKEVLTSSNMLPMDGSSRSSVQLESHDLPEPLCDSVFCAIESLCKSTDAVSPDETPEAESNSSSSSLSVPDSNSEESEMVSLAQEFDKCVTLCEETTTLDRAPPETTTQPSAELFSSKPDKELSVEDTDWESLYDDHGECLASNVVLPSLTTHEQNDIIKEVGRVKVKKAKMCEFEVKNDDEKGGETSSIIEIYGFSEELKTNDLVNIFGSYIQRGFNLKWVDNTHALGIFPSPQIAEEALATPLPLVKTRPISQATPLSQEKARSLVLPSALRPKTCSALARRLVSGALGVKMNVTPEQRAAEKALLAEAREKKRLISKQKNAAWEGQFPNQCKLMCLI